MTSKPQINWALHDKVAIQILPSRRAPRKSDRTFNDMTARPKLSSRAGMTLECAPARGKGK